MIFVSVRRELYRVFYVIERHADPDWENPLFGLIARDGGIRQGWATPGEWEFYTGSVAELLTLIVGCNYPCSQVGESVLWSDNKLVEIIPKDLVGDRNDFC